MGLQADIQTEVAEAFDGDLSDAVSLFTYVRAEMGDYDPLSGEPIDYRTEIPTRGVMQPLLKTTVDGETVVVSDMDFLILSNELSAVPEIGQQIVVGEDIYHINNVIIDPASAMWTVTARLV